ncbi:MAG: helix-turn-helix transcriptional regulator [Clostridia bacterium]
MTCGEKIKYLRKKSDLTQTELAKKVGLQFGSISKYEKDEVSIPADNLSKIADIFNVSTDYLLGRTDKREKDILDQPLQIAASMKDKTADLSNLSEGDKEVVRQMIRSLNEKRK